ncbi:Uncharacterised protein [Mycoplasmopsis citelli]|uniref:Transglutaminase-like domain-containing protein n=1 Tax=Mycoplasmopsis citelli TaxID=171281 RepID=A0A449B161_9BACT|nr:transglutaminase-like domain-containing protein [Mycoplasmopsis citelli]VEU74338.1 Uncharacterised protein [Mycoplasmopsis citelli]
MLILIGVGTLASSIILLLIFVKKDNSKVVFDPKNNLAFSKLPKNTNPPKSEIKENNIKNKTSEKLLNSEQKKNLQAIKSKFKKIILESQDLPVSKEFLTYLNNLISKIDDSKTENKYLKIFNLNYNIFFGNFDAWKEIFLNINELFWSNQEKQKWINKLNEMLINVKKWNEGLNITDKLKKLLKDFYIEKLKEQINLYEEHPYYFQPLERLKKLLYHYQNNYNKNVILQWGIDKNNKFSLSPNKYYSGNFQQVKINNKYIHNWLKYYKRWNWIFINKDEQINKIEDKNIKSLQINPQFKDNKIISDYIQRQIRFASDKYSNFWLINSQHPQKVNYKDTLEPKNRIKIEKTKYKINEVLDNINKLSLQQQFAINKSQGKGAVTIDNKQYKYWKSSSIKNFDFEKFNKYQKYADVKTYNYVFEYKNIYDNLLFQQPNLFSEALYRTFNEDLVTPKHTQIQDNKLTADKIYYHKTTPITIQEAKKLSKDPWFNPIPEYQRWFNKWKEILPNIINKKWDTKTKIKAISYYIATNSLYLHAPNWTQYNYNGYGFYNPTQIFTNDPEIQCVGYVMNLAAALTILNIPVRILGGAYFGNSTAVVPSGYHAWNEVFVDGRWKIIDLTWFDYLEYGASKDKTYELQDDLDLFLERNSEHKLRKYFRLDLNSYETTLLYFKNPKQYEYQDLPDSI